MSVNADVLIFKAVISAPYTEEKTDEEKEIKIFIPSVAICESGAVGFARDDIKEILDKTTLTCKEKNEILYFFEDNNGCIDDDYIVIDADIILQSTGLRDTNNTLIFEGDILRQPDGIVDYVQRSEGCFIHNGIAITNYTRFYQGDKWAKEVSTHEIIGNVYQNEAQA